MIWIESVAEFTEFARHFLVIFYFFHLLDTENNLILNCSFRLYFRLFLVMGLSYSMAAISFLISSSSTFTEFTEVFLALQGVWIFLLFVLKRRVFHLIKERCVCAIKNTQHNSRTVATTYIWSVCFVVTKRTKAESKIIRSVSSSAMFLFNDLDGVEVKVYPRYKDSSIQATREYMWMQFLSWMYAVIQCTPTFFNQSVHQFSIRRHFLYQHPSQ